MKTKFLGCGLAITFMLSGCSPEPQIEEPVAEEVKTVNVLTAEAGQYVPTLEVAGALEPVLVTTVAAEASGTVAYVAAQAGDRVSSGQELLGIATGDSLEGASLNAARTALANAEKSLSLARQQSLETEKQANIAIQQATENLENLKKTDLSTEELVAAQVAAAESGVTLAKLNLENAQKSLTDLRENQQVQETTISEDRINTIASAVNTFTSVMQQADIILGVTDINEKKNDEFESYLGFKEPQTKIDAVNNFRQTWNEFKQLEDDYAENPASVTTSRITALALKVRETLRMLDAMLQNTTTGSGLSEVQLSTFRTQTTAGRSAIEGIIQSITALDQRESTFVTGRPQQVQSAELAVAQAREQLRQAEKTLEQSRSGGNVNLVGTENQLAAAENQLETARTQLELTKKQGEIAVQGASAARDSAADALSSAQIRLAKFSVTSPLSGVVTEKKAETGMTIAPGTPLFEIVQIDALLLKGDVPLESLNAVNIGMEAKVTIDTFGERLGRVTNIHPIADELTRRVEIEIEIANNDLSIPAQIFATATIPLTPEEDVLMIPFKSLITQNPPAVMVIGEGERDGKPVLMAEKREIETGRKDDGRIEVISGLIPGETFIPEPVLGLVEGDIVEINMITPEPSLEASPATEARSSPSPDLEQSPLSLPTLSLPVT